MQSSMSIDIPYSDIEPFCRKWGVSELSLFGSAIRRDFGPDSDVDVLVTFAPGSRHGFFDLVKMQGELEQLFGRQVDLITRPGIETSQNHLRRRAILDSVRVIYAAG